MNTQSKVVRSEVPGKAVDYTSPDYWNGLIKMSMSKFFVLWAISEKPIHGYEITRVVESKTNGCCSPTPGALYPVLRDFEEGGYVEATETIVQGRVRKVYTMTQKGHQAFKVAVQVWTDIGNCVAAGAQECCDSRASR